MPVMETPGDLLARLQGKGIEKIIFGALRAEHASEAPVGRITLAKSQLGSSAGVETIAAISPWLEMWRKATTASGATLETTTKNFKLAKKMSVPAAIEFPDCQSLEAFLPSDAKKKMRRLAGYLQRLSNSPFGAPTSDAAWRAIYRASPEDQEILFDLMSWRSTQTQETLQGIALREVPVDSLHTKWIETHKELVLSVFRDLGWLASTEGDLHHRLGLADEDRGEIWYRLHVDQCDVAGQRERNGCAPSEFTTAPIGVDRILIVENKTTFLRLPVAPGMCLIFGSGFAILRHAEHMTWLRDFSRVTYWGDCDGAGYAILSGLREKVPHIKSVMMDEDCVQSNLHLATHEKPSEAVGGALPGLTAREKRARMILHHMSKRLEQEKIPAATISSVITLEFQDAQQS